MDISAQGVYTYERSYDVGIINWFCVSTGKTTFSCHSVQLYVPEKAEIIGI